MKASTKKLLNEQIKLIIKELEMVEDVADRVELRIEAVQAIYNISCYDLDEVMPKEKESIKENKAKKPIVVEEEEEEPEIEVEEEPEEEVVEEEEEVVEEELQEVSMDEIVGAGANLDPEVAANQAVELEQEEVNIDGEDNGNIVVQDENGNEVDVTEEFNALNPAISEDFRKEYALQIKEYGTLETYKTLDFIEEVDDEIIGYKNLVAYWIDTCELETMEYYVNYFASNIEVNEAGEETYIGEELHIDFLNANNIKGFTEYVDSIMEEQ